MIKLEDITVGTYLKWNDNISYIEIFIITGLSENFIENKMVYSSAYKYKDMRRFKLTIKHIINDSRITLSSIDEVHHYNKLDVFQ